MPEQKSTLFQFFFADGYRVSINIITLIGILLFILIVKITFSRKKSSHFNLLFIIMINVMISGILSPLAYLLNWKVNKNNSFKKELLFGDTRGFICQTQSFLLAFFQSTRETFLTLLTFLVFLNYFKSANINSNKLLYKIITICFGYGVPFISNLTYSILGAFGESHLFCFTKLDTRGVTTICGTIHFTYIFILLLVSFLCTLYIIIKDTCLKDYDPWMDEGTEKKEKRCMNPQLKKIIFYPIGQIFSMSFIFYYRFRDYFTSSLVNAETVAGICGVINAISSILYTLIFIFTNNIFFKSDSINKDTYLSNEKMSLFELNTERISE